MHTHRTKPVDWQYRQPYSQDLIFHEEEVIRLSVDYLRIIGFSEIFLSVEMMTVGALSDLGRTQLCSLISVGLTVIRIPFALVLSNTALGLNGIWYYESPERQL